MNRTEMLAEYLKTLDEITQSTTIALEILQSNAETTNLMIQEILYGAAEAPSVEINTDLMKRVLGKSSLDDAASSPYIENDLDSLSEEIAKKIQEQASKNTAGVHMIDIPFLDENINFEELMMRVQEKLDQKGPIQTRKEEESIHENIDENINFDNPLE